MNRHSRELVTVNDALKGVLALTKSVNRTEIISVWNATARVSRHTVVSRICLPPFDRSAVDGFGITRHDIDRQPPFSVKLVGRTDAGEPALGCVVRQGEAIRLATGASVPKCIKSILMEEHCSALGDKVTVLRKPEPDSNIRFAGEDVRSGDVLASAGASLGHIAILAAAGTSEIEVRRKVRVAILSTGNELVDVGEDVGDIGVGTVYWADTDALEKKPNV